MNPILAISRLAARLSLRTRTIRAHGLASVAALALAVLVPAFSAHAQDETLKPGASSPAITVADWVQGSASGFGGGNRTWVLHFFSANDQGSRASVGRLNEIDAKYRSRGLAVIGMSHDTLDADAAFAKRTNGGIAYPVATDGDKQSYQVFMSAAKREGTNYAFVVRKGIVIWMGVPTDRGFEDMIAKAVVGRYNPSLEKRAEPTIRAANEALRIKNFQDAWRHFDTVIAIDPVFFGDIAVRKYKALLVNAGDAAAAAAWGRSMVDSYSSDPQTLGELVETILRDDEIKARDFELAAAAAQAAAASLGAGDASGLALQAQVAAATGDFVKAGEFQFQAWQASTPDEKADYRRTLDSYKKRAKSSK
jgi:peroxiredoxin